MSDVKDTEAVAAAPAVEAPTATTTAAPAEPASKPEAESAAAAAAAEPQNALTKKFTVDEWVALRELRTKLPEIWRAAYAPDDRKADVKPIKLWGVTIDPANPTSDARVSVVLMKFLRAKELKVKDAETALTATLRWRDEMKIDEIMAEEFDEKIYGRAGRNFGHDKEGRPVSYNIYGGEVDVKQLFSDVPRFIRWRIQFMEKSIEHLDFENIDQMVQIHDYEGVSMMSRDANQKAAASEATNLFQNHYPEFLALKFFINVPTYMAWIFWAFKAVMSSKTFAKLNMVGTGKSTISAALLPIIDAKQLPKRYGGEADAW
ncbi:SEC14 family lipid-binding protein [Phanerochaete sordida]|uniref:SEC14 family lipid-binding protein n=1 Tax=Phanerochaete sordida TaxID=48140 RepID=A0A9P3G999_9APHY|nr:SEC14 family lipid-binding protein [Phanerochaete sordida]